MVRNRDVRGEGVRDVKVVLRFKVQARDARRVRFVVFRGGFLWLDSASVGGSRTEFAFIYFLLAFVLTMVLSSTVQTKIFFEAAFSFGRGKFPIRGLPIGRREGGKANLG
jgi:hypothetical protein